MATSTRLKIYLFTAAFVGLCGAAQPGVGITPLAPSFSNSNLYNAQQSAFGNLTGASSQQSIQQMMNIQWPSNSINLSQLQNLLNQNPGVGQFNLQFPNQANWGVTPSSIQSLVGMLQQSAGVVGYSGKLPDLAFSSLTSAVGGSGGLPQLMINPKGDIQGQLNDAMRQLRYESLDLSNSLPDWLKRIVLGIYDFVYATFDFLGQKLAGLVTR